MAGAALTHMAGSGRRSALKIQTQLRCAGASTCRVRVWSFKGRPCSFRQLGQINHSKTRTGKASMTLEHNDRMHALLVLMTKACAFGDLDWSGLVSHAYSSSNIADRRTARMHPSNEHQFNHRVH